jgi:lipooligosaccharide transport system ATP-binding protein
MIDISEMKQPAIEASGLVKKYGSFVAVDGISFSVKPGEIFGFLGPNGAGKTTTMRICECVSPRTAGLLSLFGLDPDEDGRDIRKKIGVVPQETNLDPDLTVLENLLVYGSYFSLPADVTETRSHELLDFFELSAKKDTAIEQLSGGMKRRLLLARAMINEPDLLILDEPTIGLDPQARHLIWERLFTIRGQGRTIVLTTHYLDEAERLCDRLVIMDQGKILEEGSPRDLVQRHIGMDIVEVDDNPDIQAVLKDLGITYETGGETVQIRTKNARQTAEQILTLRPAIKIITRPATLEDLFLLLTGRRLRD